MLCRKKKELTRIVSVLLMLAMVITMTPAWTGFSYADDVNRTWGNGTSSEEKASDVIYNYEVKYDEQGKELPHTDPKTLNWVKYKRGSYEPFKFVNSDQIYGINPDVGLAEEHHYKVGRKEMEVWSKIATKIFKSGATKGCGKKGDFYFGASSITALHDWNYYFENDRDTHGQINLADWLIKEKQGHMDHMLVPAAWEVDSSGFQRTDTLAKVREKMVEMASDATGIPESEIYDKRFTQSTPNGLLSPINDSTNQKNGVYYNIVIHHTKEAFVNSTYNCYAVIIYDLKRDALGGEGIYYPVKDEAYVPPSGKSDLKSEAIRNEKETPSTGTIEYSTGNEGTVGYSSTYTHGWGIGIAGGIGMELGTPDKCPVHFRISGHLDGNWNMSRMWSGTDSKSDTYTSVETVSTTCTLEPHTGQKYETYTENATDKVDYTAPCGVSYNVAICSLSGSYDGSSHKKKPINASDFCTIFGPKGDSGGPDAITNLYKRRENKDYAGESYGRTEGYVVLGSDGRDKNIMDAIDWDKGCLTSEKVTMNGGSETIGNILDERQSNIPMVSQGLMLDVSDQEHGHGIKDAKPLWKLDTVAIADDADEAKGVINIMEEDEYYLSGIKLKGHDSVSSNVDYYGFQPGKGYWEIAGDQSPSDAGDHFEVTTDKNTGKQYLKGRAYTTGSTGKYYIRWRMDKDTRYEDINGTVVTDENLANRPSIEIRVHNKYEDLKAEFRNDKATGYVGEVLSLNDALPVDVKDQDGTVVTHAVKYEFAGDVESTEAEIDKDSNLIVHKDIEDQENGKQYKIKISYKGYNFPVEAATVTVYPKKKVRVACGTGYKLVAPAVRIHKLGVAFDLMDYVTYKDQYGNPWDESNGEIPDFTFEFPEDADYGDNATIEKSTGSEHPTMSNILTVRMPGEYKVDVKDSKGNSVVLGDPISILVEENDKVAKTPEAIEGLVYNGQEQWGITRGEGYTVENGDKADAGTYVATATLKKGYDWEDGHRTRSRAVIFSIANRKVERPTLAEGSLIYNGKEQVVLQNEDEYTVEDAAAVDVGDYTAKVILRDNYSWDDDSRSIYSPTYSISPLDIAGAVITAPSKVYTGKALTSAPTVKVGELTLVEDTDFTTSYSDNVKAGKGIIALRGKGNFTGAAKGSFTIEKAANPVEVKAKTPKVKYSKTKKKAQTIKVSKAMTVTRAEGKVTYEKVSGSKKLKIDKKSGKITVKKKTGKGTYKIKVKVSAAGNSNYKGGAKTVTVKIKVN